LGDWGKKTQVNVGINADSVEDSEVALDLDWADNGITGQQEDIGSDIGIDNTSNVDVGVNVSIDIGLSVDEGIVGVVSVNDSELVAEGV